MSDHPPDPQRPSAEGTQGHTGSHGHGDSGGGDGLRGGEFGADGGISMAAALRQAKGRKRKGSLRKTALLGTGNRMMIRLEGRERRNSIKAAEQQLRQQQRPLSYGSGEFYSIPSSHPYQSSSSSSSSAASSSEHGWSEMGGRQRQPPQEQHVRQLAIPPTSNYVSSTPGMTFNRPAGGAPSTSTSTSTPTFPLQPPGPSSSLQRRRSSNKTSSSALTPTPTTHHSPPKNPPTTRSPPPPAPSSTTTTTTITSPLALYPPTTGESLAHETPSPSPSPSSSDPDEWSYTSTERWGWLVLASTWLITVVGLGSCLGVWSWAWDVGETPYAPPELEDDPTLPIVGYYPALLVLTAAVTAWVWVVVAWVGMKYFRHAKVVGEED